MQFSLRLQQGEIFTPAFFCSFGLVFVTWTT